MQAPIPPPAWTETQYLHEILRTLKEIKHILIEDTESRKPVALNLTVGTPVPMER